MKIVINTIPLLSPLTGIGKCIFYISRTLREIDGKNEYIYFYGYYSKNLISQPTILIKFYQKMADYTRNTYFGYKMRKIRTYFAEFTRKKFDIYFEPNYIILDKIKARKKVIVIYDFSFKLYPEWHPEDRIRFFREKFWKSVSLTDRIVVPSRFIRDQAINEFGIREENLRTVKLGVDLKIFRQYPENEIEAVIKKYDISEKFIVFLGSLEPRKNILNLIKAYQMLPDYLTKEFKLLLIGFKGWHNKEIMDLLKRNKEKVIYTGYLKDEELACILNKASVFVFPSLYEGFGLPPLEAMACGCPVIVSDRASLPEVCSDSALYVNPHEPEDIADKIMEVLENQELRENLIKKGIQRSQSFKWENTAKDILNIFEEVAID